MTGPELSARVDQLAADLKSADEQTRVQAAEDILDLARRENIE